MTEILQPGAQNLEKESEKIENLQGKIKKLQAANDDLRD